MRDTGQRRGVRVLHVDDDPAVREMVAEYLEETVEGLSVTGAPDARRALDRLADAGPGFDCVLSDYEMAGVDGLAFLGQVRERYPRIPFLLYTACRDDELAVEAVCAGVTDFVRKGSSRGHFTVLGNRIVNAVEASRTALEHERAVGALEAAREGICIVDEAGEITFANQAYAALYGSDAGDLVGEEWAAVHPDREPEVVEEVLPLTAGNGPGDEVELEPADGPTPGESAGVAPLPEGGFVVCVFELAEAPADAVSDPLDRAVTLLDRALDEGAVSGETARLTRRTRDRLAERTDGG